MSRHSKKAKIVSLLLALSLIFTYDVPIASIAYASDDAAKVSYEAPWHDSIHEMLSSGDYEQGVVICGIDMSKAKGALDPASALKASQLQGDAEELIKVDGDSSEPSKGFFSWFDELKSAMVGKNDGICIVSIRRDDMTTEEILSLLAEDESVAFAEPNYIASAEDEDGPEAAGINEADQDGAFAEALPEEATEDDKPALAADSPVTSDDGKMDADAPSRDAAKGVLDARDISSLQWSSSEDASLHAQGKSGEVSINVPGWPDGSNMDHEIIVAVVDMPVDFSHPDLADVAYTFSPELQAKLGCDEHGYNAKWDSTTGGKLDYWPDANHGTHVGGIIGASWDGHGTSGVASNVKIVSVQNSFDGRTSLIDTLRAYSFLKDAIESGVEIRAINNSWVLMQTSKALDAAVTELGEHGAISLFAAGNSAKDLNAEVKISALLADNPYAVIVASTDPAGNIADSSSYGKGVVDLGAPGAGIMSTILSSSAIYIPAIAQENKFYESFEDPGSYRENPTVRMCQVGYSEGDWGILYPDPEKKVEGTEGVIVSAQDGMGFEGDFALKVPIDKSVTSGYSMYAFLIDFGDMTGRGIIADGVDPEGDSIYEGNGDLMGFGFGATDASSGIRVVEADKTSTGGIIDLSVETSVVKPTVEQSPDIADVSVEGTRVVLTGTGFGDEAGTAVARQYVVGAFADIASSVSSWSDDSVELSLEEDFEGIIEVVLTARNGKKDTIVKFVSKSDRVLETDHHIGSETGEPFGFDKPGMDDADIETLGDIDTFGLTISGDGTLFYMPNTAQVEKNPAYRLLYSYDPKTDSWSMCPALPMWLRNVSGAFADGVLYIKGTSVETDESGDIPYYDDDFFADPGEVHIYSYTPGAAGWSECSAEGVDAELTLFNADGRLLFAGIADNEAWEYEEDFPAVREYDPTAGAGSIIGTAGFTLTSNPKVAFAGGHLYAFNEYESYIAVFDGDFKGTDDVIEMPEFFHSEFPNKHDSDTTVPLDVFTFAASDDELFLIGPAARDGSSDIFVLKAGETSFTPYGKRVSDAEVLLPSAAVLDGELYVIAGSVFEPNKRIFRSTTVKKEEPAETFTITYKLNGGSYNGSTADIIEEYGEGSVISIHKAPVKDGYVFAYWEGSTYQPDDEYTVEGDHTFTAQWEKASDPVVPDTSGSSAKTGDESPVWLLLALTAFSLLAMFGALYAMRRRKQE